MFISTCLAYCDVQFEINQLNGVYVLTIRSVEDQAVSFTLNYTQAKILAEGIGCFLSQTPIRALLDTQNGMLLGGATFQNYLPETNDIEQEGEETLCQQPSLSVPMANAS